METLRQGWLSPTGEFIQCASYDHIEAARKLSEPLNLPDYNFKTKRRISADDKLLNAGWAYIGLSDFLGVREWRIAWNAHLSYEQRRFLEPYFDSEIQMNDVSAWRWKEETE